MEIPFCCLKQILNPLVGGSNPPGGTSQRKFMLCNTLRLGSERGPGRCFLGPFPGLGTRGGHEGHRSPPAIESKAGDTAGDTRPSSSPRRHPPTPPQPYPSGPGIPIPPLFNTPPLQAQNGDFPRGGGGHFPGGGWAFAVLAFRPPVPHAIGSGPSDETPESFSGSGSPRHGLDPPSRPNSSRSPPTPMTTQAASA